MENADSNEDFRANLAQLRAYKSYCDITLNVKRTIFFAHKVVLGAPYAVQGEDGEMDSKIV